MSNTPDVWKVGITKTPYSAVRARQKFTWQKFGLEYLYFGRPSDIAWLEQELKDYFRFCSGKTLQGYGTELFQANIREIQKQINHLIESCGLNVMPVAMKGPYTASASGSCPFGIPGEKDADWFLERKADEVFGASTRPKTIGKRIFARNNYDQLFY
jgi:hypothetical protein